LDGEQSRDIIFDLALAFLDDKPVTSQKNLLHQHLKDNTTIKILSANSHFKRWQPDSGSAAGHGFLNKGKKRTREFDNHSRDYSQNDGKRSRHSFNNNHH